MANPRTPSGEQRFDPRVYCEVPQAELRLRVVAWVLAVLVASAGIWWFHAHRVVGADVALGEQTAKWPSTLDGARINAFAPADAVKYYTDTAWPRGAHEGLWLGNSQIYAINQPRDGDNVGPWHLSRLLGWRVFGLHVPNASFQDFLIMQEFAFSRRRPDWVVMVAVFDDLRETGVRTELGDLASDAVLDALSTSEVGKSLAADLRKTRKVEKHEWFLALSMQEIVEKQLNTWLSAIWPVWAERDNTRAALYVRLHRLRNWVFSIKSSSVRPVRLANYERNMAALADALERNKARGVRTLVYIAPLRTDHPVPYDRDQYARWKAEMRSLCDRTGTLFADLEGAVPNDQWGTVNGEDIDFMHYRGAGHVLVAQRLAEIIQAHGQGGPR